MTDPNQLKSTPNEEGDKIVISENLANQITAAVGVEAVSGDQEVLIPDELNEQIVTSIAHTEKLLHRHDKYRVRP